ncbi:MAG: transcriptional repressor LexA [Candidatus Eisenbacteria bacterium]|nr:transcriptional repressor LexA [Candidatus Eisenbacteria bacterium]
MRLVTPRQKELFELILSSIEETGHFPSYRELGARIGLRSPATISQHLQALIRKGYLKRLGRRLVVPKEARRGEGVPIIGRVPAGAPILAIESIEGKLSLGELFKGDTRHFAVRVKGDSMKDAGIYDGDYCIVREQGTAHDGDAVVACLGEEQEVTVKVFKKRQNGIELIPRNRNYKPIVVKKGDPLFRICGKVVGVVRKL